MDLYLFILHPITTIPVSSPPLKKPLPTPFLFTNEEEVLSGCHSVLAPLGTSSPIEAGQGRPVRGTGLTGRQRHRGFPQDNTCCLDTANNLDKDCEELRPLLLQSLPRNCQCEMTQEQGASCVGSSWGARADLRGTAANSCGASTCQHGGTCYRDAEHRVCICPANSFLSGSGGLFRKQKQHQFFEQRGRRIIAGNSQATERTLSSHERSHSKTGP